MEINWQKYHYQLIELISMKKILKRSHEESYVG
jgi:hypothetical protein